MENNILFENSEYPVNVSFIEYKHDDVMSTTEVPGRDAIEVLIVNNGTLRILCDDQMFTATAGQGFIVNRNKTHRCTPVGNENCGVYSVLFGLDIISGGSSYLSEKYVTPFFEDNEISVLVLLEDNLRDEKVIDSFNKIIAANLIKKNGYEMITKGYLSIIWITLLEYVAGETDSTSGKGAPSADEVRVYAALSYISENYADQITLDDLANHIHVSTGECCRCFKRVLMRTPFDYIMEFRIYQALKVLYKNPIAAESIFDLAMMTGFNNISYFNKVFRKYTQLTPTAFRKLIKSDPERAEDLYRRVQESVNEFI
ncbi:MAG: AraC family transcriptional regulator [Lachnospiraceae bacterium]|nr:AraC family transcriptional regulator [Lachnospiraceae bacterium]